MSVDELEATRSGDTVFMTCALRLTARRNGVTLRQPFSEVLRFKDGLLLDGVPFYHDTHAILEALGAEARR
jgi:ketosteroid isomerase-like protein